MNRIEKQGQTSVSQEGIGYLPQKLRVLRRKIIGFFGNKEKKQDISISNQVVAFSDSLPFNRQEFHTPVQRPLR